MKNLIGMIALVSCLAASAAAHVYPQNPDPEHTAFFGQLGRDSIVVTNAPAGGLAEEIDPTVPAWAKEPTSPAPGNYQVVSNKAMNAVQQGTLATVATSGSYNDLLNKPTIPEAVTDQHIKEVAEENRTDHPYLEVRDGGIYVVIPE